MAISLLAFTIFYVTQFTQSKYFHSTIISEDCLKTCTHELYYNEVCDPVCNTLECKYDNYACECLPGCHPLMIFENEICDESCNFLECAYDNNICEGPNGQSTIKLLIIIGSSIVAAAFLVVVVILLYFINKQRLERINRIAATERSNLFFLSQLNKTSAEKNCEPFLLGTTCCICFDEYMEVDIVRKLTCGHTFHSACIVKWITDGESKLCPLCYTQILV